MPQPTVITLADMERDIRRAHRCIMDVSVDDVEIRRAPNKHYVYVIYVSWSDGTVSIVYRQYEEFLLLEKIILQTLGKQKIPNCQHNIPQLPGKIILGRNNVQKVALRRQGLLYDYCKVLLSLPRAVLDASRAARFFEPTDLDIHATLKRPVMDEKRRDDKVDEISSPILEEKYIVIADYTKSGEDQLDLKAGDAIQAFIKDESGWWLVLNTEGKHGWIPSSYLEKVDGTEEETVTSMPVDKAEKYMTLANYDAQYSDEVNLEKGTVVEVLERTLDGWWLVRAANTEGRAPSTNLAKADSLKVRQALEKATLPDNTINYQDLNFDSLMTDDLSPRLSMFDLDMEIDADDYVDVWMDPDLRRRIQEGPKKKESTQESSFDKNVKTILSLKRKTSSPPPRKQSIKRVIASIDKATPQGANIRDYEEVPATTKKEENLTLQDPADETDTHDYYNVSPFEQRQSKKEKPMFEARSMFKAGDSGETDLVEGEIVPVLDKTGTGWWLVQSQTGLGWVPSHFLKPLKKQDSVTTREKNISEQEFGKDALIPKVTGDKIERRKAKGHIANRYIQGATGKMQQEERTSDKSAKKPEVLPKPPKSPQGHQPSSPKGAKPVPPTKPDKTKIKQPTEGLDDSSNQASGSMSVRDLRARFNKS